MHYSLLIPTYRTNTTSTLTTTVLFLSLYRTFDWKRLSPDRYLPNACIIALTTAALCALKSSVIPACGIFFLASYLFYWLSAKVDRRKIIYEFLIAVILILLLLFPWMLSMYRSSGTLLYPLLGEGYHASSYSNQNYHYDELSISEILPILVLVIGQLYFICLLVLGMLNLLEKPLWKIKDREALFSLLISALLGTSIVALAVGEGPGVERYPIPFVNAAIIATIADGLTGKNFQGANKFWHYNYQIFSIFFAILLIIQMQQNYDKSPQPFGKTVSQMVIDISKAVNREPFISEREMSEYRAMQKSIPAGETILTRLDKPFLLDFKRNPIFVADWPGQTSPPPGMPLFQGSEALADYLIAQRIRYLAYSYGNEANVSRTRTFWRKAIEPESRPWLRNLVNKTFDFQDNLAELGKTRRRIYDDGKIFVLDLQQMPADSTPSRLSN